MRLGVIAIVAAAAGLLFVSPAQALGEVSVTTDDLASASSGSVLVGSVVSCDYGLPCVPVGQILDCVLYGHCGGPIGILPRDPGAFLVEVADLAGELIAAA